MKKGQKTLSLFSLLEVVWPDLLSLTGDVKKRLE
jgi:hypothetical protein